MPNTPTRRELDPDSGKPLTSELVDRRFQLILDLLDDLHGSIIDACEDLNWDLPDWLEDAREAHSGCESAIVKRSV